MPDETGAPTEQEVLASFAQDTSPEDNRVSRIRNLLGAASGGFASSILGPAAGAARFIGNDEDARKLDEISKRYQGPLGIEPTNPTMEHDFSTGLARAAGSAPVTLLTAEGGLPALVGTGAVSGYGAYKAAKEDYDARAAAGELLPDEQPPSPYKEIGKGAASNAAFILGGGAGAAVARRFLPALEGTLPRVATAYGANVGGNLAGSAAARTLETGSPAYESPAAMGEDFGTAFGTFGPGPTKHLLADPRAKFGYKPPPKPTAAPGAPLTPTNVIPELSLSPLSQATVNGPEPAPRSPTIGEAMQKPVRLGPDQNEPWVLREAVRRGEMEVTDIPESQGGGRLYTPVKNFIEPVTPTALPAIPTEGLVRNETTPEGQPPAPTLPTNETRNETQLQPQLQLGNGPEGVVDQTINPGELVRGQSGQRPGPEVGLVQEPLADQPGGEAQDSVAGLRGQSELGPGAAQRPVLAPVPESPQTLIEQQKQLVAGKRPAVLFTPGEAVPDAPPPGMKQITTDNGTYFFNPEKVSGQQVLDADTAGRQNELLGLGPENKADVVAAGGKPVVVTERTPDGVEVKAAASSPGKVEETKAALEQGKTEGNVVAEEAPESVLAARRNQAAVEDLHAQIGALDEQLAQARRTGFIDGKPAPGPEAAAARDALPDLTAKREDLSNDLMNFTPESEGEHEPLTARQQAHADSAADLGSLLENARQKLAAQQAVVDSLRPENAKKGVDENGNTVEDLGGLSKEDREAFNEAKAEAASLRRGVQFLEQKLKDHERSEPQVIGAPALKDTPAEQLKAQGFYSKLSRLVDTLPDALVETAEKRIPGREIKAKEIRNPKTGELIKSIPGGKEPDKVYPSVSVADQLQKLAAEGKVNPDELKWSGIIPWLKTQGKAVSRQQLQEFIREVGTVKVEEKYFGHDPRKAEVVSAYQAHRQELEKQASKLAGEMSKRASDARKVRDKHTEAYEIAKKAQDWEAADVAREAHNKAVSDVNDAVEDLQLANANARRVAAGNRPATIEELREWNKTRTKAETDFIQGLITAHERDQRLFRADAKIVLDPRSYAANERVEKASLHLSATNDALREAAGKALADLNTPPEAVDAFRRTMRLGDREAVEGMRKLAPAEVDEHLAALKEQEDAIGNQATVHREVAAETPMEEDGPEPTTYQGYMKPFAPGENYHEVIVTMPKPEVPAGPTANELAQTINDYRTELHKKYGDGFRNKLTPEENAKFSAMNNALDARQAAERARRGEDRYQAPHFGGEDIVFHYLADDRTDTKGRDVAFIQESQSDRHQAGARKGYKGDDTYSKLLEKIKEKTGLAENEITFDLLKERGADESTISQWQQREVERGRSRLSGEGDQVPDAPYRKTFFLESVKRRIRDAVHAGQKYVGWNVGDTLNERYNLSQAVKKITWEPIDMPPGTSSKAKHEVTIHPQGGGGEFSLGVSADGEITSGSIRGRSVVGKTLAEVLGNGAIAEKILKGGHTPEQQQALKEAYETARINERAAHDKAIAAEKALDDNYQSYKNDKPTNAIKHDAYMERKNKLQGEHDRAHEEYAKAQDVASAADSARSSVIEGEGFKIGGAGKRKVYDQIATQDVGDYIAQWGGKMEKGEMPTNPQASHLENVLAENKGQSTRPYHVFEITPEMERAVREEGQPIAAPKAVEDMAKRYKVEPEKVQAFVDKAEAKDLPKFEAQVRQLFGEGVEIVRNSDKTETIGVVPTRDGGVEIHVGPNYVARTGAKFGEGGGAHLAKTLGEEAIHVAVLRAIKEMWQKAGAQGDFYVYTKGVMSRISNDILGTVKGLRDEGKHSEAHAIEEAIRNSKELYDGELENANSLTGRQILEQMAKDPTLAFKYGNELLRQFAQLRQNKQITETTYQRIARALTDLYRRAQQSLRNVVGKAHEGELGKTAGEVLRRTEELLQGEKPRGKRVGELRAEPETLRQGTTHLEDNVIPWHGGADEQDTRTSSRDTPGYPPRAAAADYLESSRTASEGSLEPHERHTVELARLAQFEAGRGRLIDRAALVDGNPDVEGGGEHQVYLDPASQRWIKFTRPGATGLVSEKFETQIPLPENLSRLSTRGASPSEYLERMRLGNEKLGDDQKYHGVWLDKDGEPGGLVISQPHVEGTEPSRSEVSASLTKDGFKRVGIDTWYRPTDRVMIDDATPRNFVLKNGRAEAIDVPIRVADDALHTEAMRQIDSGQKFLKAGERKDLPFPPVPDNRQVIGAPRFVEKAAKTVEEKTREFRYLWGKSHRHFKDSFFRAADVIDTTGNNAGAKTQDRIYVTLSRAGGGKHEKVAEPSKELKAAAEEAFPLREAGFGDATSREEIDAAKDKLQEFRTRIERGLVSPDPDVKTAAEALKPIYDRAAELVDRDLGQALARALTVAQETNRQLADAATNGIDIEGVDNYIRRVYSQDLNKDPDAYIPSAGGKGGPRYDKGFLKPRAYESAVEAMENGKKVANFDVAQLVGQGEASLQKLIGEKRLNDELRSVAAPVTGKPVMATGIKAWNPRLREFVEYAPDGYRKVEGPGGKPIYVEQNVAPLFNLLASPSWLRGFSGGRLALKVAAGIKHGTLLFDSYHLGRQTANLFGLLAQGGSPAEIKRFITRGLSSLDVDPTSLDHYVREGHITEADKQYVLKNQERYKLAEASGVNFGKQLDNLYEQIGHPFWVSILNKIPKPGGGGVGDYITDFNKYVFQKSARAAMLVGFNESFERNQKRFPNKTQEEVGRLTAREINETFGNMGRQGIFKSKTAQDISRLFILAPQWNDARWRFQGRAVGQLGKAAGKLLSGNPEALGNAGGTLLALAAGAFAANQVINLSTRGKPTWDNEDGHKLDAWIPGGKNGFFYSPLNLAAEDIHTAMKYGEKGSPLDAAKRIALNKSSGVTKAAAALAGIDPLGRPMPGDLNRLAQAGKSLLPIPIFASPLTTPMLQPELAQKGDLQRQAFGMAGIKLDRAESPEQRLRALANKTQPKQFPKIESPGDYSRLRSFVTDENLKNAKEEILGLVSKGKTEEQIRTAFKPTRTYTTSKGADLLLMRQPGARELLQPAQQDRVASANFIAQAIAAAKRDPRYVQNVMAARELKRPNP